MLAHLEYGRNILLQEQGFHVVTAQFAEAIELALPIINALILAHHIMHQFDQPDVWDATRIVRVIDVMPFRIHAHAMQQRPCSIEVHATLAHHTHHVLGIALGFVGEAQQAGIGVEPLSREVLDVEPDMQFALELLPDDASSRKMLVKEVDVFYNAIERHPVLAIEKHLGEQVVALLGEGIITTMHPRVADALFLAIATITIGHLRYGQWRAIFRYMLALNDDFIPVVQVCDFDHIIVPTP